MSGNTTCAPGHMGPLCSVCEPAYFGGERGKKPCLICEVQTLMISNPKSVHGPLAPIVMPTWSQSLCGQGDPVFTIVSVSSTLVAAFAIATFLLKVQIWLHAADDDLECPHASKVQVESFT